MIPYIDATLRDRFEEKYERITETGCWVWTAGCDTYGYGQILANGKIRLAHRVSYEINVGEITAGRHVLHKCDTPCCVNPAHLYLGTHRENMRDRDRRSRNGFSKKTHCPHGHEYTAENTRISKQGKRGCVTCLRKQGAARARARRQKLRLRKEAPV